MSKFINRGCVRMRFKRIPYQISSLFETSKVSIDPLSPKAEYDLAAFVGTNFDAQKCAERYHKCDLDRTVIGTALGKIKKKQKERAPEKKKSKNQ